MQMAYWMRIAVGAILGVVALLALWPTLGIAWVTALVAALLAAIGFLGSYFVVSADRPEEGYEQVLFDKPNTLVAAALVVLFAAAGVGTGFLPGASAEPLPPADYVFALKGDYQAAYDGWTKEDAEKEATLARIAQLRAESDRIAAYDLATLPEGGERQNLTLANDAYAFALDALKACVDADSRSCVDARVRAADGEFALQRLVAASAPAAAEPPEA
jgi:hypothetical protein